MRYLVVLVFLVSCAIPSTVPTEWDICADILCPAKTSCYPMFEEPQCVPDRTTGGFCELSCDPGKECHFDICVEPNEDGSVCEFDDACYAQEICVLGKCTGVICEPGDSYPCYSGPVGTVGVGQCRYGVHLCNEARIFSRECIGEITPLQEVGLLNCNGMDDNCDGIPDPSGFEDIDLVFAFDLSGSMRDDILAVSLAITETASLYNSTNVYMGLIGFPGLDNKHDDSTPAMLIPLSEYDSFQNSLMMFAALLSLTYSGSGGEEPSWDLPEAIFSGSIEEFSLRSNARTVMIMFTDETGQSYEEPENTESSMCEVVEENNIDLYILTLEEFYQDFDDCSTVLLLSPDYKEMVFSLSGIVKSICS